MIGDNDRFGIRPVKNHEWDEAMRLAWDTFLIFEAPDYSLRGVYNFKNFIRDPLLKKMHTYGEYIAIGAFMDERIVGILGVRNVNHVSLLFVDRDHHHQGIATSLMESFFKDARKEGITHVTVNASPYAIGFYHKIGFMDVSKEVEKDGIRFTPMRMEL